MFMNLLSLILGFIFLVLGFILGFTSCFLGIFGVPLGIFISILGIFLNSLGFTGVDEVAVEFEHGFYVLLVTTGGKREDNAVYTIFVGFFNSYWSVIYFLPTFADTTQTTSSSFSKFD